MEKIVTLIIRAALTGAIIGLFGYALYYIPQLDLQDVQRHTIDLLTGAIISAFTLTLGWWFASSKGSSDKTDKLSPGLDPELAKNMSTIMERLEVQSAALEIMNQDAANK